MHTYAILTDSGTDTPQDIIDSYPVYIAPLQINYSDGSSFFDRVDITPDEVTASFTREIPSTSLPPLEYIETLIAQIVQDGYDHIMVVAISSKLSGTLEAIKMVAERHPELTFAFIDSKNIAVGAGMLCALAARYLDTGLPFGTCADMVARHVDRTKIFFCIPTLEYLIKGGRIGKVASIVGTVLNLVPVITCDEEGIYTTVGKARVWNKALDIAVKRALDFAEGSDDLVLVTAQSEAPEEAESLRDNFLQQRPNPSHLYMSGVSPALTVHTGPKVVGLGVQKLLPIPSKA